MEEQLITFETAVLAKEKRFNIVCLHLYEDFDSRRGSLRIPPPVGGNTMYHAKNHNDDRGRVTAPTQSLLQKWLREIHGIDVIIDSIGGKSGYFFVIQEVETGDKVLESMLYGRYEHVLELGLKEALRMI